MHQVIDGDLGGNKLLTDLLVESESSLTIWLKCNGTLFRSGIVGRLR